ncbi:MAG: hypothetical protein ACOC7U_08760 [Spirochaetota bacterium]
MGKGRVNSAERNPGIHYARDFVKMEYEKTYGKQSAMVLSMEKLSDRTLNELARKIELLVYEGLPEDLAVKLVSKYSHRIFKENSCYR